MVLSGCVWPACSICARHSARLEHACIVPRLGPGRSIGGWDTLADESFSPRQTDGELLVLMCLRHGTEEDGRKLGGEPAIRFAQLLQLSGIPVGQDDQVVPTDYFNGLVASAVGRLPQPLSAADLADLWDSLWFLLMATADGKPSGNFFPLGDRQDQLRWFSQKKTHSNNRSF